MEDDSLEEVRAKLPRLNSVRGSEIQDASRQMTGLCHHVYRITTREESYILRIGEDSTRRYLKGSAYWIEKLSPLRLPIPEVIFDGTASDPPYQILSFLPGQDLGLAYANLMDKRKREIAAAVVTIQKTVAALPKHEHFGHMFSYEQGGYAAWEEVVQGALQRSKSRIAKNGVFDVQFADHLLAGMKRHRDYFKGVSPTAFLEDITTKNTIVSNEGLSGIVDLDEVCFGDWLMNPALTHISLLSSGNDTVYTEHMIEIASLGDEELKAYLFYQGVFCVDFMSEIGMRFNRDSPLTASREQRKRLQQIFEVVTSNI
jgi:aminoglycoside phosphotransferase